MSSNPLQPQRSQPTLFGKNVRLRDGGIHDGFKGINYQMKVLLRTIIKSYETSPNANFEVGIEIFEAANFDDIVLNINGKSYFIQTKSKKNPKDFHFLEFFSKAPQQYLRQHNTQNVTIDKDFDLYTYFREFLKAKATFPNIENIVICTNKGIVNPQNNLVTLRPSPGSLDQITFNKITPKDDIFGDFEGCYKIDKANSESSIRRLFDQIGDLLQSNAQHFDEYLQNLMLIVNLTEDAMDEEIEKFLERTFNSIDVDLLKRSIMGYFYDWLNKMRNVQVLNKPKFQNLLKHLDKKCTIIPKVIDRSSGIFRSNTITFECQKAVTDFIKKIEFNDHFTQSQQQLFYLKVPDGETLEAGCLVYQDLKYRRFDSFLILKSSFPESYWEDGLDVFSCTNTFNFLIILENLANKISNEQKNKFTEILNSNRYKKALIITDRDVSDFQSDIRSDEENLLKLNKFILTNITKQSLETLLANEVSFQGESVKFQQILSATDHDLHKTLYLSDLRSTKEIGRKVTDSKIYDNDFYIPRRLRHRNIVSQKILEIKVDTDKIVFDEVLFQKCCTEYAQANVHLLKRQIDKDDFEWLKTRGNIGLLLNYVVDDDGTCFKYNCTSNESVFVLIDVAGMGKTYWLNHVAFELKKKFKDHFIINISFSDHRAYFDSRNLKDDESVLNFFETEILNLKSDLEVKLLREACMKNGKVYVILDGLDEVIPGYDQKMFDMIEVISKMKISQFYISTRPHSVLSYNLQKSLGVFCHKFEAFSKTDQINFLKKIWNKQGIYSDICMETIAGKIIDSMEKIIGTKEISVAGIPLITKIIAEIYESKISYMIQKNLIVENSFLSLSDLYKEFISKKIQRYVEDKLGCDPKIRGHKDRLEECEIDFKRLFQKLAVRQIFPNALEIFEESQPFQSKEINKMVDSGLVFSTSSNEIVDEKDLKFIHRTFAEFFVHSKLIDNLGNEAIAEIITDQILTEDSFAIVRFFLNDSFIGLDNVDLFNIYGKFLMGPARISLEIACSENNPEILYFLIKSLMEMKSEVDFKRYCSFILFPVFIQYLRNIHDNLRVLRVLQENFSLEFIKDLLQREFIAIEILAMNPINCKLMLSWMRENMKTDQEFWEDFLCLSNRFLSDILEHSSFENCLYQILDEFNLIESEVKIKVFEKQALCIHGLDICSVTCENWIIKCFFWFEKMEKHQIILKIIFPQQKLYQKRRAVTDNQFHSKKNLIVNCELKQLEKFFQPFQNVFDIFKKTAFWQLIEKSKVNDQTLTTSAIKETKKEEPESSKSEFRGLLKVFKTLISPKVSEGLLEINHSKDNETKRSKLNDKDLKFMELFSEIFQANDDHIEIIHDKALCYFAYFYISDNLNDPNIIELLLTIFSQYNDCNDLHSDFLGDNPINKKKLMAYFNDILLLLHFNDQFKSPSKHFGRFVFDHMFFEDLTLNRLKLNTSLGNAEEFFRNLRQNKMQKNQLILSRYYRLNLYDYDNEVVIEILVFLLISMIESSETENDRKIIKHILKFEIDGKLIYNFPEYFSSYLDQWFSDTRTKNPLGFDYNIVMDMFKSKNMIGYQLNDLNNLSKLIIWNIDRFENDHQVLRKTMLCCDKFGDTFLRCLGGNSQIKDAIEKLPNEIFEELLKSTNNCEDSFLYFVPLDSWIFSSIAKKFGTDYLQNLLCTRNKTGDVFIDRREPSELFKFSQSVPLDTIKVLILNRNFKGKNVYFESYAKSSEHNTTFLDFVLQKFGSDVELFKEIFDTKISHGEIFLKFQKKKEFLVTKKWVMEKFPYDYRNILLEDL